MTKAEIITEMESKGAVNVKDMGFDGNLDYNENEIHPIKYRRQLGADQQSEPETLYLIKQSDDSFVYQGGKPAWMGDAATQERDPLATSAEIVSLINAKFQLISDSSYTVSVGNGEDIISARVVDSKDDTVTTKRFSLFDDKGTLVLKEIK